MNKAGARSFYMLLCQEQELVPTNAILTEDGQPILTEDGAYILYEDA